MSLVGHGYSFFNNSLVHNKDRSRADHNKDKPLNLVVILDGRWVPGFGTITK